MFNVFDTEQEAYDAQLSDFMVWKSKQNQDDSGYWDITTSWDMIQQRQNDNKWVYRVCPDGNQDHTQEEEQEDWFPVQGV